MNQIDLLFREAKGLSFYAHSGKSVSFYNTIQNKRGSILNVWINLITIKDKTFIRQISKRINALDTNVLLRGKELLSNIDL